MQRRQVMHGGGPKRTFSRHAELLIMVRNNTERDFEVGLTSIACLGQHIPPDASWQSGRL